MTSEDTVVCLYDPDDRLPGLASVLDGDGLSCSHVGSVVAVDDALASADCVVLVDDRDSDWHAVHDRISGTVPTVVYTLREGTGPIREALARGVADVLRVPLEHESLIRNRVAAAADPAPDFDDEGAQLRSLLRSYPHTLFVKDTDSRFANITTRSAKKYGHDRTDVVGLTDFELLPEDLASELYEEEQAIVDGERTMLDKVEHYVDEDGRDRWVSTTKVPRYDSQGNVLGVVGGTHYVTTAKRQEQLVADLHEASQRLARSKSLEDVAKTAVDIAAESDPFTHVEVALVKDGKVTPTAATGDSMRLHDEYAEVFESVHVSGTPTDLEGGGRVVPIGPYGVLAYQHAETAASPEFVDGLVKVFTDNVEAAFDRAERERQLTETTRRIEEFAKLGSHELRNKLQVVVGNVADAQNDYDDPRLDRSIATLERVDRLLEQLLQLARTGSVPHEREWVDVEDAARSAWRTIEKNGHELSVESTATIDANHSALVGLFEFLLENVVDHAGEGTTATVGSLQDRAGFYVEDDGHGLEDGSETFEAAYTTGKSDGGYGLYVTKSVVDAHEWAIDVTESEAGGARFEITGVTERVEY